MKLAIIATHPIQYYAPWFRYIHEQTAITLKVFYLWDGKNTDKDFEENFQWDVPLLEGYDSDFIPNVSADPGTSHFNGLKNPQLLKKIHGWNPDAVLMMAYNYRSTIEFLIRWNSKPAPVIFRGDSHDLGLEKGRSTLKTTLLRFVYKRFDALLYVGKANLNMYRRFGIPKQKLFRSPHAIDNDRFSHDILHSNALEKRNELGISADDLVFLFVGKFIEKKQPMMLVEQFIKAKIKNSHLVLCGSGPLESNLKKKAKAHSNIHFLGFTNQASMPAIYQLGDIVVLPSKGNRETWGLCVNEAFACSKPAIVSNHVGCHQDFIYPNKTGWIYDAENSDFLLNALKNCEKNKNKLRRMGTNANKLIQNYSYEEATKGLIKALESVSR